MRRRNKRWFMALAIGFMATIMLLVGCDGDEPTPESAEQPSGGGTGGSDSEQEEESGAGVFALDVVIDPLPESVLNCKELNVKIIVFNFNDAINDAGASALFWGSETGTTWVVEMTWLVEPFASGPSGTGPQADFSQGFDISTFSGEVDITATVEMIIREQGGDRGVKTVGKGSHTTKIQIEKCPLKATLEYSGTFSDGTWTFTESATMGEVILEAEGDGPYAGAGTLAIVVSQTGNPGGGECQNVGAPMRGSSAVDITGDIDESGEMLDFAFDFQSGEASGGQMTCEAAGFAATVPMASAPFNPGAWGVGSQDFPTNGGTQDVGVTTGLRGAPGSGVVGIEIEPLDVQEVAALDWSLVLTFMQ